MNLRYRESKKKVFLVQKLLPIKKRENFTCKRVRAHVQILSRNLCMQIFFTQSEKISLKVYCYKPKQKRVFAFIHCPRNLKIPRILKTLYEKEEHMSYMRRKSWDWKQHSLQ